LVLLGITFVLPNSMKTFRIFISILIVLKCSIIFVWADNQLLEVGIFREKPYTSIQFVATDNTYKIYNENDSLLYHLQMGEKLTIRSSSNGKQVRVKVEDEDLEYYGIVYVKSENTESHYKIKAIAPNVSKERMYFGGLKCFMHKGVFTVVSLVSMHHYLIGVIESESGNHQGKEYYKVQAIISRTYALKNIDKMIAEGFMLNDMVTCQVYLGKMYRNPKMEEAVLETKNLVIVDDNCDYITAAFYSNSGGQTANVEDVWNKPLPYLRSIKDPFSIGKPSYSWTKTMRYDEFVNYLDRRHGFPTSDSAALSEALNYKQVSRGKYFVDWKYHILLTDMRVDLKLKSTFFSIEKSGDQVIFKGKGFGHGVGLSQEGAMNMCDVGYSYTDVIHFYYTGVFIIDRSNLDFYKF
jgi:stage II sporulation protein D